MTTYRVGAEGATVFTPDGEPLYVLAPGQVVVPGSSSLPGSLAQQHALERRRSREAPGYAGPRPDTEKRRRGYADKRVAAERDYEDKA
jgi:hypothetical protein